MDILAEALDARRQPVAAWLRPTLTAATAAAIAEQLRSALNDQSCSPAAARAMPPQST
jgi:hypothetical protein